MSRARRLLELVQTLRQHRHPVAGDALAQATGVSLRTLYRDIATLRSQGAHIDGEPGMGYVLRPGFLLPPLMFSQDELEALVLGSRWVAERGDGALAEAARTAVAKVAAVLPEALRESLHATPLLVGPGPVVAAGDVEVRTLRSAIRSQTKMVIEYVDLKGERTRRTIWPFVIGFFDSLRVVGAWCELRQGYRHFRTDRIAVLEPTTERYPRSRTQLLREWREQQGIAAR
jgi:predicted DNA-binding transcriptional regulator YafY